MVSAASCDTSQHPVTPQPPSRPETPQNTEAELHPSFIGQCRGVLVPPYSQTCSWQCCRACKGRRGQLGVQGVAAPLSPCPPVPCPCSPGSAGQPPGQSTRRWGPGHRGPGGGTARGHQRPWGPVGGTRGSGVPPRVGAPPGPSKAPSPGLCLVDSGTVLLREGGTYWGPHCVPRGGGTVTHPRMCPLGAAPPSVSLAWLLGTVTLWDVSLGL